MNFFHRAQMRKSISLICILIAAFVISSCQERKGESTEDKLVVNSWGGWPQKQQSETMFNPFSETTGIKIVELSDGENQFARAKAQIGFNGSEFDLIDGDASWLVRGQSQNLWAPIDYEIVDKTNLFSDVLEPYGVGIVYWSVNIVYNTTAFPESHPTDWAEVWDFASKNPGRVAMWGAKPDYTIEIALMAAGYDMGEIYPLNEEKLQEAFISLEKIKGNVRWYDTGAQAQKLFSDEEVVLGMEPGGLHSRLLVSGRKCDKQAKCDGIYQLCLAAPGPGRFC